MEPFLFSPACIYFKHNPVVLPQNVRIASMSVEMMLSDDRCGEKKHYKTLPLFIFMLLHVKLTFI